MGDPNNPSVNQPPRKENPMQDEAERQTPQQQQDDEGRRQQGDDRESGKEKRQRDPGWRRYDDVD